MKALNKLFFVLLSVALCAGFASCSDDDDDKPVTNAQAISGTYKGTATIEMFQQDIPNVVLTIAAVNADSVSIIATGLPVVTTVKCGAKVKKENNGFSLVGQGQQEFPSGGMVKVNLSGNINNSSNIDLGMDIDVPGLGVITADYSGKKQ